MIDNFDQPILIVLILSYFIILIQVILLLDQHKFWNLELEVNYKVDRLLTGLSAQQIGATAR